MRTMWLWLHSKERKKEWVWIRCLSSAHSSSPGAQECLLPRNSYPVLTRTRRPAYLSKALKAKMDSQHHCLGNGWLSSQGERRQATYYLTLSWKRTGFWSLGILKTMSWVLYPPPQTPFSKLLCLLVLYSTESGTVKKKNYNSAPGTLYRAALHSRDGGAGLNQLWLEDEIEGIL